MAAANGLRLSRREREVAALVADGLTDQEIADRLFLSRRTAEGHVQAIRNKLGLDNRAQVAAWYASLAGAQRADWPAMAPGPVRGFPAHLTSFFGRERELSLVRHGLSRTRAVTLCGPGGAGKTRLAIRAAGELTAQHPGGTWFVDLAPVTTAGGVLPAVAAAAGVRDTGGDPAAAIGAGLAAPALAVLDNCEQVVQGAAAAAAALLACSPHMRVLATGREPLLLDGELVLTLAPLRPPDAADVAAAQVARSEAAQLFCDRASLSDPGFVLEDANAAVVGELCRRLDGVPLALELAAAQVGPLGLDGVSRRLGSRLDILQRRSGPPRHHSLTAAMRWSYDLLDEQERALFRRLSVFRGGFGDDAAREVCGEVTARLPGLAAKSLVLPGSAGRWHMLETVRLFAEEMLAGAGELADVRDRHRRHFEDLAARARSQLEGPDQAAWLQALDADHRNLLAALGAGEDAEARLRLASDLYRFWLLRGHLSEARAQLEAALAGSTGPSASRPRALNALAGVAWRLGDYPGAALLLEEGLAAARSHDIQLAQRMLANLGVVSAAVGDFAGARAHYVESLELARKTGDRRAIAVLESNLGLAAAELGEEAEAEALLQASLGTLSMLADGSAVASTLSNLGLLEMRRGRPQQAVGHFASALEITAELGDAADAAGVLEGLAGVAALESRPEDAVRLAGAAAALRESAGTVASPAARARVDRWLPAARGAVGEKRAAVAWESGRRLPSRAAIDLGRNSTRGRREEQVPKTGTHPRISTVGRPSAPS